MHVRKNTDKEDYRIGLKYNIEKMEFSQYADQIIQDQKIAIKYYLAATNIGTIFPQVAPDFEVPQYIEKVHHGPYLWASARGHYEFGHVDSDDGLLCMISGTILSQLTFIYIF